MVLIDHQYRIIINVFDLIILIYSLTLSSSLREDPSDPNIKEEILYKRIVKFLSPKDNKTIIVVLFFFYSKEKP